MHTIPDNATRIKRFREVKATLRTARDRLVVGIDIAKAQHVAQIRLAHTRLLEAKRSVPNTEAGFAQLWEVLRGHQAATGARELVCALEPTGTYHQALARFLEERGACVVLVSPHVAHCNRKTLEGTWDKSDPKDAHNLADLLEQGKVLFYSLPDAPITALRQLVRLLRRARGEVSACKARFRNTVLPALAPAGEPLPTALAAAVPAPLQAWLPAPGGARRRRAGALGPPAPAGALPAALDVELADLTARVTAAQARGATLEQALVRVAEPLPASALLRTIPGIGPTVGAILLAEIGDIAWYTRFSQLRKLAGLDIIGVQTGQWAGTRRISKAGRTLLRWALYQAALGAARSPAWRARRDALLAKRRGDRFAFLKANVELSAKLLRLVWGVWRSGRPYDPARALAPAPAAAIVPRPIPFVPPATAPRRPRTRTAAQPAPAVRVTLGDGTDRVRFAARATEETSGTRRQR